MDIGELVKGIWEIFGGAPVYSSLGVGVVCGGIIYYSEMRNLKRKIAIISGGLKRGSAYMNQED